MQVALEQPSGGGLDILMPESISTLQPGRLETPAASSMPQMFHQREASKVPLPQTPLSAVLPKTTQMACHVFVAIHQVSEGPPMPDSKLVATGRSADQRAVLEERVREAAAACSAAKQRRRSLFAQVAASTSASQSPSTHIAVSSQEERLWSLLSSPLVLRRQLIVLMLVLAQNILHKKH